MLGGGYLSYEEKKKRPSQQRTVDGKGLRLEGHVQMGWGSKSQSGSAEADSRGGETAGACGAAADSPLPKDPRGWKIDVLVAPQGCCSLRREARVILCVSPTPHLRAQ